MLSVDMKALIMASVIINLPYIKNVYYLKGRK